VQLHWDDYSSPGYVEVAGHLQELQRRGLVTAWGVCNWDVPRLLELIEAGVKPATNQVRAVLCCAVLCCAVLCCAVL